MEVLSHLAELLSLKIWSDVYREDTLKWVSASRVGLRLRPCKNMQLTTWAGHLLDFSTALSAASSSEKKIKMLAAGTMITATN